MPVTRWLRANSERYLLRAAQERVSRAHGANRPRPPRGLREWWWLRVFAPAYRTLPWPLRQHVLRLLPGSHRRTWHMPTRPAGPAV
jgi:hypothetical protein